MLGLTQQQAAELVGVTYQQSHKYEKGINRVAAGRLPTIAQALGVEVSHFFTGLDDGRAVEATPQQRLLLELARNFIAIPSRRHQEALCHLARTLANPELVAVRDGAPPCLLSRRSGRHRPSPSVVRRRKRPVDQCSSRPRLNG